VNKSEIERAEFLTGRIYDCNVVAADFARFEYGEAKRESLERERVNWRYNNMF
jgi:hypothetical protein